MSKTEDWVRQLVVEESIDSTATLPRNVIQGWWEEYKETFQSDITEESFKRLLRKARWENNNPSPPPKVEVKEEAPKEKNLLQIIKPQYNMGNVLVIADLHEPFTRKGYMEFCLEIKKKYNCQTVVFLGDILDNHALSYHETSNLTPYSTTTELLVAKDKLSIWYKNFPNAYVCLGNHDQLSNRKAMTAGLSAQWIRTIGEVLDTPTWTYSDEFVFDNVKYCHGIGRQAKQRMTQDLLSCIQGHYHSLSYIHYAVGLHNRLFAMQLGSGIDDKSFAFAYGKHFAKSHINCGVVLNNGTLPIIEYMDLDKDYK